LTTRALPLLLAAIVALALAAPAARAADDPREVEGRALFAKGEYQKALDIYASLFAESGDPLFLRNIGRCYQKLRVPDKSIDAFREYLRRSPGLKPSEQAEVDGFIKEMEDLRREQAAAAPPPPPPIDLRAREPAPPPAGTVVTQPEAPREQPVYTRWWFWTGIAAVAAGVVLTAVALSGSPTNVGDCMGLRDCVRVKN
jgi:tetratricopeptide (TPR) repeat protein